MENPMLDAAFRLLIAREVRIDPLHPYVDADKARSHELKRQFPGEETKAVEDAYGRAKHLLVVACELADLNRGPRNEGTGPAFDRRALSGCCPGFSEATYDAALNEGFMRTR